MTQIRTASADSLGLLSQPGLPVMARLAVAFAVCVTKWSIRHRTRRALRQLEPWQLADVGLTSEQAATEASRTFWQG
jgi:uncharacterized protein YjiS (DUF1127 family)